ncbi:hypothetical protein ED312_19720 [Sinomicrobium pectinilyticum]|uniref:Uncharacterized protein n=1 Tax=Sinomicrobium pectinilyticum TaxID=1084421 RepID=A0A3N0DR38_SINP1|nr:hypothetical protein ED312_19720 [Sinomicrobium pectinilyticum]
MIPRLPGAALSESSFLIRQTPHLNPGTYAGLLPHAPQGIPGNDKAVNCILKKCPNTHFFNFGLVFLASRQTPTVRAECRQETL